MGSPSNLLSNVPLVVDEGQINQFNVYLCDGIRRGMQYRQELYGLVREVAAQDRSKAYQLGCELLSQGLPVLMTASKQRYVLWINLRYASAHCHLFLK